jgi:hypothetical protein
MTVTNFSQTYSSDTTVAIPVTATNIVITVAGGGGGTGGSDTNGAGGSGGAGTVGTFTLPNYLARTLTLQPGARGSDGPGCFGRGTPRTSGAISGGAGGSASGCSGSGAGGGSGSGVYDSVSNSYIIVAGGGGGGGGGAWNRNGTNGGSAGGWSALGSIGGGANGGGASCGDGSGGGGGGGGAGGGGGGSGGCDNSSGGTGGGGGGSGYNSGYATFSSSSTNTGAGYITVSYTSIIPQITNFYASPNPQTSGTIGVPSSSVNFAWQTVDATSVSINQGVGFVTSNGVSSGNRTVDTGLQSVVGINSPATKTYTLTAYNGNNTTTAQTTVSVYNDNQPNDYNIPNLFDVEPNIEYLINFGPITGIDMLTALTCSSTVSASKDGGLTYSGTIYIGNGDNVKLKVTSLPLNTNPIGLANVKDCYVDIGPIRRYFQIVTRAPNIEETFDMGDNELSFPFPKIDITSATVSQYTNSPTTLTVNDIELSTPYGTEISTTAPEAEFRFKTLGSASFGPWTYLRQYIRSDYPFGTITQRTGPTTNTTPTQLNTRVRGVITTKNTIP